jgi:hypothetical protein
MALLVLWLAIYFLVDVFRGHGAGSKIPPDTSVAVLPGDDTPIPVEWELLPDVE